MGQPQGGHNCEAPQRPRHDYVGTSRLPDPRGGTLLGQVQDRLHSGLPKARPHLGLGPRCSGPRTQRASAQAAPGPPCREPWGDECSCIPRHHPDPRFRPHLGVSVCWPLTRDSCSPTRTPGSGDPSLGGLPLTPQVVNSSPAAGTMGTEGWVGLTMHSTSSLDAAATTWLSPPSPAAACEEHVTGPLRVEAGLVKRGRGHLSWANGPMGSQRHTPQVRAVPKKRHPALAGSPAQESQGAGRAPRAPRLGGLQPSLWPSGLEAEALVRAATSQMACLYQPLHGPTGPCPLPLDTGCHHSSPPVWGFLTPPGK